jgi:uncharacterized membrane-anchored protein
MDNYFQFLTFSHSSPITIISFLFCHTVILITILNFLHCSQLSYNYYQLPFLPAGYWITIIKFLLCHTVSRQLFSTSYCTFSHSSSISSTSDFVTQLSDNCSQHLSLPHSYPITILNFFFVTKLADNYSQDFTLSHSSVITTVFSTSHLTTQFPDNCYELLT